MSVKEKNQIKTSASDEANAKQDEEIEQLRNELAQAQEDKLKVLADFQNFRKRIERERSEATAMANKYLLNSLLELVDDMERAVKYDQEARNHDVFRVVREKLTGILQEQGLEVIDVKTGDKFVAEAMEALTTVAVDDPKQDNRVIDIDQLGYRHSNGGQIYRPARVITGKYQE